MNFFNMDSPLMKIGEKLTDIMLVNILMVICSIPIITIGASYTAMHYVLLKIHRDETGHIVQDYFHAFKINFKDATIIWGCYLLFALFLGIDYLFIISKGIEFPIVFRCIIYAITVVLCFSLTWVFILLSRYENSIKRTIINSLTIGFANLWKTIVMAILMVMPYLLLLISPRSIPIVLLIGIAALTYLQTALYDKIFIKIEQTTN